MTRSRREGADAGKRGWWLAGGVAAAAAMAIVAALVVADSGSPAVDAPVGAQRGEQAPQVSLPTAGGDEIALGGPSRGLIVASFLAPGCPSCEAEVPSLREVREAFPDAPLQVVIVDVSGAPLDQSDAIAAYYRDQLGGGTQLVYALDPEAEAVRAYEVRALGTTLVLDADGIVTYRDEQTTPSDLLRAAVEEARA